MKIRARFREESGQSLVLVALSFSILMAFTGLAIDSAVLFRAKRNIQTAADAAAQGGALDYLYNHSHDSAVAAARALSSSNGYADGTSGVTVTVNTPPASGPSSGVTGYVETIVSAPVNMTVMAMFGFSTVNVQARAVAGSPTAGTACIWLMNANGADLNLQGSYTINAPSCGIYMNSTSSGAVNVTGNGGVLNALFADAVGGSIGHQTSPTSITTYTAPRSNPWGNITGPNGSTGTGCDYTDTTTTSISGSFTQIGKADCAKAGATNGQCLPGAGKTLCFTKAVTLTNATFGAGTLGTTSVSQDTVTTAAGTLVFGSGVTTSGTVTVYGGTLDIYSGTFTQPSNSLVNVIAPTSGTYNGIAIMEPSSNTNQLSVQKGSANQVLDGYIYAPGAQVYLQDNGGGISASGIVADNLYLKSSTITIPSYDVAHPSSTPNRVLTLLE
jgi:hypothetical protein